MISEAAGTGTIGMSPHAWIGLVIFGVTLGAGLLATVSIVQNTRGPRERAFVALAALSAWIASAVLLGAMCLLPAPYNYAVIIPYFIVVPLLWYGMTCRQMRIRERESCGRCGQEAPSGPDVPDREIAGADPDRP